MSTLIWIGYTTRYREGGAKFARVAATMEADRRAANPACLVRSERVESKLEFVRAMERVRDGGHTLAELHFVGHSGMYGPMFRTTSMPEQFSPHEWRNLRLPFAPGASAYFHACRTARWFAPFFARTFAVTAHGYHWYTTISTKPDRFTWEGVGVGPDGGPLYVIAIPGKKSHGVTGSALKYSGLAPAEAMKRFEPRDPDGDTGYDGVAELYAEVFGDIGVRRDEWRWLKKHLPRTPLPRVLDLGCGNGALLAKLAPRIAHGVGVDRSSRMIDLARGRAQASDDAHLRYQTIDGPALPFADRSFDAVISLLSFRYLDWDPIMNEIRRVLAPGGRLLVVDMVTVPLRGRELPCFARSKARQLVEHLRQPEFRRALRKMVGDPRWQVMLKHNPIRSDHELRWYLESRFPGRRVEILTIGWNTRVVAFDSGPLEPGWVPPQSYP
ncbi:MAG TPA: class I SAM-dependent methyltransferase [Polyangia bacterium]|nr:class I SAM-dependent methyltransferase [Polyangia bacterium]